MIAGGLKTPGSSKATDIKAPGGRHYGMDWLRIGAFGLLILYHVGMYFVPSDWHIKTARPIDWAVIPMLATNAWRLALLFAVSGYASRKLIARLGGPGAFIRSRSARLLIPLLFGMAVIVPVQPWVELMAKHGYAHGFLHFWIRDYFRFGVLDGIMLPTWNHLWFVAYLWVYSVLLGFALWLPPRFRAGVARMAEYALAGPRVLIVPMALLALKVFVLAPGVEDTHALVDDWAAHLVYAPLFLFGWLLGESIALWSAIRRWWRAAGLLAVAGYAVAAPLAFWWTAEIAPFGRLWPVYEGARICQGWGAIVALIGLADRFLNRDHPTRATLVEGVFPFYIIHQSIIVLVGWALLGYGMPALAQFLVLVTTTTLGCWLFYRAGRTVPGLRLMIGLKGWRAVP